MISVSECAAFAGLASNELVLGAVPSAKHRRLLASYLLGSRRGLAVVRDTIVADLRGFLDLGVTARAADLLIVLRMFLTDCPQARLTIEHREKIVAGETRDWRAPREASPGPFPPGADDRGAGVVVSLRRPGRKTASHRGVCENPNPAIARLGSRLFYLRGD